MKKRTQEPQYDFLLDLKDKYGLERFGLMANESWLQDPKRTLFTLARYKFVAKMLSGEKNVLEVGCADAFGTRIVQQAVENVTAADFDPLLIEDAKFRISELWPIKLLVHDFLRAPLDEKFDAAYALDVLEHIKSADEDKFLKNIINSLHTKGVLIIGMPSLESQTYASPQSKEGHVNCKSGSDLKILLKKYFDNVFMFSMNDETIHTGFFPMAHYLIGIGCGKK
jgi:2-polyprenyl-3-methyl-5-hydroxy-6-metoxy-1,4-benzoquinol methylase